MTKRLPYLLLTVCTPFFSDVAGAQAPPGTSGYPAFEIASIKPSPSPRPNRFGFPVLPSIRFEAGGRVNATQATIRDLILRAYDLLPFQLVGGPEWMNSARFDVAAKAESGFSGGTAEIQAMLRSLLGDRFKLRVHTENREAPVYHLVLANREGKLGPQLRRSSVDSAAMRAQQPTAAGQQGVESDCQPAFDASVKDGTITMKLKGESLTALARLLSSPETRRVVLDKTEVEGTFDGVLAFVPEPLPGLPPCRQARMVSLSSSRYRSNSD